MRTYRDVGEQHEPDDAGLHQPRGGGGPGHHGPSLHRGQPQEDHQAETPQLRPGREYRLQLLCCSIRGTAEAGRGKNMALIFLLFFVGEGLGRIRIWGQF